MPFMLYVRASFEFRFVSLFSARYLCVLCVSAFSLLFSYSFCGTAGELDRIEVEP